MESEAQKRSNKRKKKKKKIWEAHRGNGEMKEEWRNEGFGIV